MPMSLSEDVMPELVRLQLSVVRQETPQEDTKLTPRERRLYIALAVILSLNLSVICGALTFFGLLFRS